jgi:hypothetical protein
MGCLLALFAFISPRFVLGLLYLFTNRLTIAFSSGWEGLIGFFVLPYTTLFYALVYQTGSGKSGAGVLGPGVHGFGWLIVAVGVLLDLSSMDIGRRARLRRSRRAPR